LNSFFARSAGFFQSLFVFNCTVSVFGFFLSVDFLALGLPLIILRFFTRFVRVLQCDCDQPFWSTSS
jgi:hypothetical protein